MAIKTNLLDTLYLCIRFKHDATIFSMKPIPILISETKRSRTNMKLFLIIIPTPKISSYLLSQKRWIDLTLKHMILVCHEGNFDRFIFLFCLIMSKCWSSSLLNFKELSSTFALTRPAAC